MILRASLRRLLGATLYVRASVISAMIAGHLSATGAIAQSASRGILTGVVVDSTTGRPLDGAQLTLAYLRAVAITRGDGRFVLPDVEEGRYTLEVRRLGYQPSRREVDVRRGSNSIEIRLAPAALRLTEVVTTGVTDPTAGTRVPFTVARVDSSQLSAVPGGNALGQLQGKVAGATVVTSPAPGSGVDIQLRTPSSVSKSNMPLIVLDGIVLSQSNPSTADLQALDIASAEVVKGAAAASLYGSRAANGVISLKSRRGSSLPVGRTEYSLRTEIGTSSLPRSIPFAQYHAFRLNDAGQYVDANGTVVGRNERVEREAAERFQDQRYPDPIYNQLERFFDRSPFGLTSLSMARNSGNTSLRASIANNISNGVVPMDGGYTRNDFRLNLDQQLSSTLTLALSAYHSRSRRSLLDEGENSAFFDLINQAPDVNLRQPDPDGTPFIFQPDSVSQGARPNPLYMLSVRDWRADRVRTLAGSDVRWTPISWLSFDGTVSYDRGDEITRFHFPRGAQTAIQSLQTGAVRRADDATTALNASASATVTKQYDALSVRSTLRALMEREDRDRFEANAQNLSVVGVPTLESGLALNGSSFTSSIRTNGFLWGTAFDLSSRYIVDLLLRRDGSSLFGADERWQDYYRVSAAWRMAEEPWWPLQGVSEFKLRGSRGTAGGRPSFSDQFETYSVGAGGVLTKATLGNPALRPELATETEFGLDAIVGNRVSLQFTHARSRVQDQLVQVPLPAAAGYPLQWQNAGEVRGNSTELTVEAQLLRGSAVTWTTGFVADRTQNHLASFERPCFRTNTIGFYCAGVSLGSMWGATFVRDAAQLPSGLGSSASQFQLNDDGLLVPVGENGSYTDARWGESVVINGTSLAWGMPITLKTAAGTDSIVQIGDGNPRLRLGWSNTVSWRGFTIYGLVDAQVGGKVYNRTRQRMYQYNRSADVDQVGKAAENRKPTQYYTTLYNANSVVDWFVEDAGFVKLREVSVRYRLSPGLLRPLMRTGVRGASVSLIGRNLFTRTKYTGYDPEIGTSRNRLDDFIYPAFRTVTGSIQVDF